MLILSILNVIFKEAETQWGGNRLKSLWTTVGGWG